MENLLFNIDSVEVSYGDNALTSIVQINERIQDIERYLHEHHNFNDFEKSQLIDRLSKLEDLNRQVQRELVSQTNKLAELKSSL